MEDVLSRAQIVDTSHFEEGKVHILSRVKIKNLKNKKIFDYLLVSPEEADFQEGKITFPLFYTLKHSAKDDQKFLLEHLGKKKLTKTIKNIK